MLKKNHEKKQLILVISNDTTVIATSQELLKSAEFSILTASYGYEGLKLFHQQAPHLVLLSTTLPDTSGMDICRQIRYMSDSPILMISESTTKETFLQCLDVGSDDILCLPLDCDVLRAFIIARLARINMQGRHLRRPAVSFYDDGYLTIDLSKDQVLKQQKAIRLTPTEFALLQVLFSHGGQVLSYEQILQRVWGENYGESTDYVHVYISGLRRKLGENPNTGPYIITEHGVGYRFQQVENVSQDVT